MAASGHPIAFGHKNKKKEDRLPASKFLSLTSKLEFGGNSQRKRGVSLREKKKRSRGRGKKAPRVWKPTLAKDENAGS